MQNLLLHVQQVQQIQLPLNLLTLMSCSLAGSPSLLSQTVAPCSKIIVVLKHRVKWNALSRKAHFESYRKCMEYTLRWWLKAGFLWYGNTSSSWNATLMSLSQCPAIKDSWCSGQLYLTRMTNGCMFIQTTFSCGGAVRVGRTLARLTERTLLLTSKLYETFTSVSRQ